MLASFLLAKCRHCFRSRRRALDPSTSRLPGEAWRKSQGSGQTKFALAHSSHQEFHPDGAGVVPQAAKTTGAELPAGAPPLWRAPWLVSLVWARAPWPCPENSSWQFEIEIRSAQARQALMLECLGDLELGDWDAPALVVVQPEGGG